MKTKIRLTELQASYKAMVDSVEEFMVKEGKTLQQAFYAAEEKLEDANEISKEKIKHASKYLKDNLLLWSDAVEGVSAPYKEEMKSDLAYVNNSFWDKFQSISNSNTVELMAFTKTLKEEAQTVRTEDHFAAYQDHNQWAFGHALWLNEIELWKKDHEQVLTKLMEIKKALTLESTSIFEHAQVIQSHIEIDHKHEKIMKNAEQDPSNEVFKVADENEIAMHKKEWQIHAQHSESHHALKMHHFKIMAMINMLYKQIH